ncbi:MAG: carbonic anhydrase [Sideroxydans sp.]|nr:carbonic anhydrase [Sideroxydans sp.]
MSTPSLLIAGFARFRRNHFSREDVLYRNLVEQGQTPKVMIVGCCDSRVDPALIFDCAPGDLFVIRNVANLVPPAEDRAGHHGTTAALEYGVCNLAVEHIVVLGHAHCGGIHNLLQTAGRDNPNSYIDDWMSLVEAARLQVMTDFSDASDEVRQRECEQRAIVVSLQNLLSFSWIAERVASGTLALHGWYFDIESGQLLAYQADREKFISL